MADPLVLPDTFAQVARNARFDLGNLTPFREASIATVLGTTAASFYLMDGEWLEWNSVVSVAKAPVAPGRIYITGDGTPKVRDGATTYELALPAPVGGPTIANLGTPDPALLINIYYAYTYVTSLGEESPPSPLSNMLSTSASVTVRVNAFTAAPAGRAITNIRIYRSQSSTSGVTELFFAAEIAAATTSYDHDLAVTPLAEAIPSTDYDPPMATLAGLVSMPNGMMAAFSENNVYFCEPYVPHAWPDKYSLTTDWPIVGLAVFGSILAVLTTGAPYIMQGTHPDSMVSEKMEKSLPCLSRRGIVDIGSAALYPSADGLVMITAGDARVISRNLFSRDQWAALQPASISAARFNGKYFFMRTIVPDVLYVGSGPTAYTPGSFTGLEGSGPTLPSGTITISGGQADSRFGLQQLGAIDYEGGDPSFVETDLESPVAMLTDDQTSELYLLRPDRQTVVQWESRTAVYSTARWRSKPFVAAAATFGAIYIKAPNSLPPGSTVLCSIFADGKLVASVSQVNQILRLPSIPPAMRWEIDISANIPVTSLHIASTVDELVAVL